MSGFTISLSQGPTIGPVAPMCIWFRCWSILRNIPRFEHARDLPNDSVLLGRAVEGEDDGSYSNLMFEIQELQELWASLWDTLYKDENVGSALSQASMAMCEGRDGWNDYLLLYHFDPTIKLDTFDAC